MRQLPVTPAIRALSTLTRIDYADTFVVDVGPPGRRTAEEWARAILEDAPLATRSRLLSGWTAIGLKLDLGRPGSVLGWEVRRSTPDVVLLGADSRIGMRGELLFGRERRTVRFATFVQHESRAARVAWMGVERVHVPVVRSALDAASRRLRSSR